MNTPLRDRLAATATAEQRPTDPQGAIELDIKLASDQLQELRNRIDEYKRLKESAHDMSAAKSVVDAISREIGHVEAYEVAVVAYINELLDRHAQLDR